MNHKLESKSKVNIFRYEDDATLMAEIEEEWKKPLDDGKRGELKSYLKLNI